MCQIPPACAAPPRAPPPPPPKPKPLNPHAQPYKSPETARSLCAPPCDSIFRPQPPLVPGLSFTYNCYTYNPVYLCQPKLVWTPLHPPKVDIYNAYRQPHMRPYDHPASRSVGKVFRSHKVALDGAGCSGKKTVRSVKRFISPRCRLRLEAGLTANTEKKWSLKEAPEKNEAAASCDYQAILQGKTSLMIKNVPNHFDRHELLKILDKHCRKENSKAKLGDDPCRSEYDFVYLPMDFGFRANLGYAFVNFTSAVAAIRFCRAFDNYEWEASAPGMKKKKTCQVTCAAIQGKDGLVKNFENSKFSCHTSRYLPVILSPPRDGWNQTKPTLLGRCIGLGGSPPSNMRKVRLMKKKKLLDNEVKDSCINSL